MEIYVTGFKSGLGKFLLEEIGGIKYDPRISNQLNSKAPKIIIHCGYKYPSTSNAAEALAQMESEKRVLKKLLQEEALTKVIFISSIDVYPYFENTCFTENSEIDLRDILGIHGFLKLSLENLLVENTSNFLILRPSMMLGKFMRGNSVSRIVGSDTSHIPIASNSTFNLISHQSVADFINIAIKLNIYGIFNLCSSTNISLDFISSQYGRKKIKFGTTVYKTPILSNSKVLNYCDAFNRSSAEVLNEYVKLIK
jgi:nucleoside-diphosphate-sugar epimerase